ncbi:MAG: efflux RND transporter periplasmic adaptor subunit, partial [Planctomycetota bacterium]
MTLQDPDLVPKEAEPVSREVAAAYTQRERNALQVEEERNVVLHRIGSGIRFLLPILLIVGGYFAAKGLIAMRPKVEKSGAKERSIVVETMTVETGSAAAEIIAYGTVAPLRSLTVRPQVAGVVTEISPRLLAGGRLDEGELLFRIDPRDYQINIETARADLVNARFELELEKGRANIAQSEWELLEGSIESNENSRRLALREPQAEERAARVAAAESLLARAELDLARTEVRAPFPALVVSETIEKGQLLTVGAETARIVDTSVYVVEISLPASRLGRIPLPNEQGGSGARASVQLEGVPGAPILKGRVARLLGEVDPQGRMARLQIEVEDPLGLKEGSGSSMPLLVGAYARVSMEGTQLEGVAELPRSALREG